MDRLKGVSMLCLAAVASPCHLPILLARVDGTTVGAVQSANVLPVVALLGVVFVGALALGLRLLESGSGRACAPQKPQRSR